MSEILDIEAIRSASLDNDPYPHIINSQFIRSDAMAALDKDFPDIKISGFHPVENIALKGTFHHLIEELKGPQLTTALSEKFHIDLTSLPSLISVRKLSAAHEGRIHCDSTSKVMSLLLYMNQEWNHAEGQLRVLYNATNITEYKAQLSPQIGTVFAFLRTDNSWHGHTSFVGERRVVQVAWLRSQKEANRKKNRHRLSGFIKNLFS